MMPHSVRRYKIISLILAGILIASILSACLGGGITPVSTTATSGGEAPAGETQTGSDDVKANVNPVIAVAYDSADQDDSWTGDAVTSLSLSDETIQIDGAGAVSKDGIITITAAGTYLISGSLSNGQIIVNAQDGDLVMLILNGVSLTCLTSAPIFIVNADKVVLVLARRDGQCDRGRPGLYFWPIQKKTNPTRPFSARAIWTIQRRRCLERHRQLQSCHRL